MEKKIKNILDILNASHCPFAGNGKDQWLSEILFKSSFERYNIMEWILEQLGINILEVCQNENSVESKIQNLTEVFSAIGVCSATDSDIIEGIAPMKRQLTFWNFLCSLLSKRSHIDNSSLESVDSNDTDSERNVSEYASSIEYVSKVCECVNLNDSFNRKLQLFPSHLSKEVKEFFKKSGGSLTSDEIRKNYFDKFGVPKLDADINSYVDVQQKDIELKEFENKIIPEEVTLNEVEDSIAGSLKNFENLACTFENVHDNLKPFLTNVKPEEFIDIGPAFKATDDKLNSLLKLKNAASSLKSLDSELEVLKSDVTNFHISSGCLSGDKLEEYLEILSLMEHKE